MSASPASEPLGLTLAISGLVAAIGGLIAVYPEIDTVAEVVVAMLVVLFVAVPCCLYLSRRIRAMARRPDHEGELTGYTVDAESGVLFKGSIENVALRVSTLQNLIWGLASQIEETRRAEALAEAGYSTGREWAAEFRSTVETVGIDRGDTARQLARWAEYDASAGMGRLSLAVTPQHSDGMVALSNSFLSRRMNHNQLDHWFAGYVAGTLEELLGHVYEVTPVPPSSSCEHCDTVLFRVQAVEQ